MGKDPCSYILISLLGMIEIGDSIFNGSVAQIQVWASGLAN